MTSIFVVMNYDYSSTSCMGAFLDRDKANAFAWANGGLTVEEYDSETELTPEAAALMRPGMRRWQVRFYKGTWWAEEIWDDNPFVWEASRSNEDRLLVGYFLSPDEEGALKMATEYKMRWLANGGMDLPGGVDKRENSRSFRGWGKGALV